MAARKWEHDGVDMSTAPRDGGDFDWGRIKHRHNMVGDSPRIPEGVSTRWVGVAGRTCNRRGCSEHDPRPVCVEDVRDAGRWPSYHRCERVGTILRDVAPFPVAGDSRSPARTVTDDGAGWYYCAKHDPVAVKARQDARDAADAAAYRAERAKDETERDLIAAALAWYADEAAAEGFCAPDAGCEHHECRLARAAEAYHGAR